MLLFAIISLSWFLFLYYLIYLNYVHLNQESKSDRKKLPEDVADIMFNLFGAIITSVLINAQPEAIKKYTRIFYVFTLAVILSISLVVIFKKD